jgi:hypothetical protein
MSIPAMLGMVGIAVAFGIPIELVFMAPKAVAVIVMAEAIVMDTIFREVRPGKSW